MDSKIKKTIDNYLKLTSEQNIVNDDRNKEINNELSFNKESEREILFLPIELILEIISHLNEIADIRSCMLLCKQIRVLMYKTPTIMRKIKVSVDLESAESKNKPIIQKRGKFIRNLKVEFYQIKKLPKILSLVPNLEVMTFRNKSSNKFINVDELEELRHLKVIKSDDPCHRCFLSDTANITKLWALKFCCINLEDSIILTNFLCRQTKLQELTIVENFGHQNFFLVRDISDEIQFKLTKFEYTLDDCSENFLKFLKSQAENLLELDIRVNPNYNVLHTIFTKCKKLEKFTTALNCQLTPDDPSYWTLTTLQHFIAQTTTSVNLNLIHKRFPNLKTLVCLDLAPCEGTFHSLETLYMTSFLDCRNLNKLKLPNLKNLTVSSVEGSIWKHSKRNFPKIENLMFIGNRISSDYLTVVKSLDYYKDMKSFKQIVQRWNENNLRLILSIDFIKGIIHYESSENSQKIIGYLNEKYGNFSKVKDSYNFISRESIHWNNV